MYIATSLEDIAQLYDQSAEQARRGAERAKTNIVRATLEAEARTWEDAARILRNTTLTGEQL